MAAEIDFDTFDPVEDKRFPRITGGPPLAVDWPNLWNADMTQRDHAALVLSALEEDGIVGPPRVRTSVPSLTDYRAASLKGWGAGWPSCAGAISFGTAVVTADRSGARFSMNRRIAVMWDLLIDRMEERGYLCKPVQCGGYNCRPIAGTKVPSNHSWALAGDINWLDNPYTSTGRRTMPLWVPREIFNPLGFAWGGDYAGARKDYMHLEFMGTPAQADEMTHKALAAGTDPFPPVVTGRLLSYVTGEPMMTGEDVRLVQRVLRAWYALPPEFVDGEYGPATVTVVKRAQAGAPPTPVLLADGIVGPATRRKLGLPG